MRRVATELKWFQSVRFYMRLSTEIPSLSHTNEWRIRFLFSSSSMRPLTIVHYALFIQIDRMHATWTDFFPVECVSVPFIKWLNWYKKVPHQQFFIILFLVFFISFFSYICRITQIQSRQAHITRVRTHINTHTHKRERASAYTDQYIQRFCLIPFIDKTLANAVNAEEAQTHESTQTHTRTHHV